MDAVVKFKGLEDIQNGDPESEALKVLNKMEKVIDVYKKYGDLDMGKLKDDGLLKLECGSDGNPIPIRVHYDGDEMTICIGQMND